MLIGSGYSLFLILRNLIKFIIYENFLWIVLFSNTKNGHEVNDDILLKITLQRGPLCSEETMCACLGSVRISQTSLANEIRLLHTWVRVRLTRKPRYWDPPAALVRLQLTSKARHRDPPAAWIGKPRYRDGRAHKRCMQAFQRSWISKD